MPQHEPGEALSALSDSLPALEEAFAPLLQRPWSETLESMSELDRAKVDILMAYAINDLVWIYLKLKGVDPDSHEVTKELDRIKTYYTRVRAIENPETRRTIDAAAASRMIFHSLPSQTLKSAAVRSEDDTEAGPSTAAQALAQEQARRAVEEQDTLDRLGKAQRFRFVDEEGEKLEAEESEDGLAVDEGTSAEVDLENDGKSKKKETAVSRLAKEWKKKKKRKRAEDFTM